MRAGAWFRLRPAKRPAGTAAPPQTAAPGRAFGTAGGAGHFCGKEENPIPLAGPIENERLLPQLARRQGLGATGNWPARRVRARGLPASETWARIGADWAYIATGHTGLLRQRAQKGREAHQTRHNRGSAHDRAQATCPPGPPGPQGSGSCRKAMPTRGLCPSALALYQK
jgi:hypothetical protein